MPPVTYRVYVVELSKRVFTENARFRAANPQFNGVLECVYVGMTSKTPAERLQQHKTGYVNKKGHNLSASIVYKYGGYLRPSLYDHVNLKPMNRQQALALHIPRPEAVLDPTGCGDAFRAAARSRAAPAGPGCVRALPGKSARRPRWRGSRRSPAWHRTA